jgi:hypothetical protein
LTNTDLGSKRGRRGLRTKGQEEEKEEEEWWERFILVL